MPRCLQHPEVRMSDRSRFPELDLVLGEGEFEWRLVSLLGNVFACDSFFFPPQPHDYRVMVNERLHNENFCTVFVGEVYICSIIC